MRAETDTHFSFGDGILYATPISTSLRTTEVGLVRGVLQMMQGLSGSLFYWDQTKQSFCVVGSGVYVTHLSRTSLSNLLRQFLYAATCLKLVEGFVTKVESGPRLPTLRAFASVVSQWLKRLRDIALKEEINVCNSNLGITPTLLGLSSSLSSLCSGAEFLLQIVNEAIPQSYFEPNSCVLAAEIAVHVLDYLYRKLDEVCLVQDGEEEAYKMILHMLVGSLLPFVEGLDTWLFQGTLDDPFDEMFFYANKTISTERSEFWEQSYQLRQARYWKSGVDHSALTSASPSKTNKKEMGERDSVSLSGSMKALKGKDKNNAEPLVCPLFIKEIANSIVAAGKSLQLIRHVPISFSVVSGQSRAQQISGFGCFDSYSDQSNQRQRIAGLTLSEIFCVSVAGLIGHADRVSRFFLQDDVSAYKYAPSLESDRIKKNLGIKNTEDLPPLTFPEKIWYKFLVHTLSNKKVFGLKSEHDSGIEILDVEEKHVTAEIAQDLPAQKSFCAENPVITVSQTLLDKHRDSWEALNLSRNFCLPPLNDEVLREAVFGAESGPFSAVRGTNYAFGFQFGKSEYLCSKYDAKLLEVVFPFPTLLPSFKDDVHMSQLLPFQENSTLPSRVLSWIQSAEPRITPLPIVIMQECLTAYMKKQVDYIGRIVLLKLMNDWRLMEELAILRMIYLLGSGDLLQHFLTVLFNKLDKGETLDDDFELNNVLQESIRNSADGMLLSASDSLVVSITKNHDVDGDDLPKTPTLASTPHKIHQHAFGIDGLASLKFTYKVPWPLELIATTETIKKYNQVMGFLLKVKRAKFVLDKARRWMWKGRATTTNSHKHHWLLEQKLLHFVDAFHQYVMDRVSFSSKSSLT